MSGLQSPLDLPPWGKAYPVLVERNDLLIGQVAARSGLSRKALRLYESRGILPPPRREPSGYRRYPPDVLRLLKFVGQARRLGLTLSEIKHIVALRRSGAAPCVHIRALVEQKAADLEGMLAGVRSILGSWRANGRHAAICPNIEAKGGDTSWERPSSRSALPARPARKSSLTVTLSGLARTRTSSSSRRRSGTS
ncbi:MAG: hypothetical protein DME03_18335 [Candidatus Rokuibacteriota bacterium]|nr:MAG: hypothetical protein DME03_18335 [Candidatus Rokubacteria bacterium]